MSNVMGTVIMFQSTHSLRSATPTGDVPLRFEAVSIHALLAECDLYQLALSGYNIGFNPRTPCGVRPCGYFSNKNPQWFQSTHSLRSATSCKSFFNKPYDVSIHALLAECDSRSRPSPGQFRSFNPRTPCGVRQKVNGQGFHIAGFQSTHSLRSATTRRQGNEDRFWFQSTHSLRSATGLHQILRNLGQVSIHALLAECDACL